MNDSLDTNGIMSVSSNVIGWLYIGVRQSIFS